MNKNFDEVLNEGIFKSEKNTLGGEDLKIVNDAIHYMKYIEAYSWAIKYYHSEEMGTSFFDPKDDNYKDNRKKYLEKLPKEHIKEASVPKPKDKDNLKKGFFQKDQKLKFAKLLNTAVIRYEDLYQKMFQLLGKYTQLQKIYGPYTNNNQMFANMFDCPTWEERKGMGKFSTDEQILTNLEKFKKNLEKLINSGQVFDNYSKTVSKLLQDPTIKSKYSPELLDKIVKNLQLESINESEELDLDTETEKSLEILKSLLISYSDSEERMQKLADPKNVEKIKIYISSKIKSPIEQNNTNMSKQDMINNLTKATQQINNIDKRTINRKKEIVGTVNSVLDALKKELGSNSDVETSQGPSQEKIAQLGSNTRGK